MVELLGGVAHDGMLGREQLGPVDALVEAERVALERVAADADLAHAVRHALVVVARLAVAFEPVNGGGERDGAGQE